MRSGDAEQLISTLRAVVSADSDARAAARSVIQKNRKGWKVHCVRALKHDDAVVRHGAVVAIGELRFENDELVTLIRAALQDPQDFVRAEACWLCASREEVAANCLAEISPLTADDYWPARQGAVEALASALSWNARIADRISALTRDPSWNVRCSAADSLGRSCSTINASTKVLLDACRDAQAEVRLAAIRSLGDVVRGQEKIAAELTQALADENFMVREEAARALQALSSGALPAVPQLIEQLSSSVDSLRTAATSALKVIGKWRKVDPDAEEAVADISADDDEGSPRAGKTT